MVAVGQLRRVLSQRWLQFTAAKLRSGWNHRADTLRSRVHEQSFTTRLLPKLRRQSSQTSWLNAVYECGERFIRTKDRLVEFKFAGLRHNIDSIKSKSRILLCWADEAEPVSAVAWQKLIPTVREEGSEIWLTWNPESNRSATHKRFRESPPEGARIVEMNYRDND